MRYRFLLFCLLGMPAASCAQDYNDSIRILMNAHPQPDSALLHKLLNYNVQLIYSQPEQAIANFDKFELISVNIGCRSCLLWALKDQSISVKNTGNYNGALEILFKALSLATADTKTKAGILNNIANVYLETKEFDKAILYLNSAVQINEQQHYLNYLGTNYNNLGLAYRSLDKNDKALEFYKRSIDIRLKLGPNENLAQSYLNLADLYSSLQQTDTALSYLDKAFRICDSLKSEYGLSFVYASMGSTYLQMKDYGKAKEFCLKSRDLSKKVNNMETLISSTETLTEIYRQAKDFEQAFLYQKEYYDAKDSVYNVGTAKKQLALEYQNELNIKKAEQDKIDYSVKQEMEKQKLVRNILICGFAVTLLLSLIILNGYRNKRKVNRIIAEQKEQVEFQKVLLEEKQKEVLDSIQYAKRIQQALMATEKYIHKNLSRLNKKL
jgi:tetratricopeptide (TPR) repeat protein